jgi:hypothetical protein
MTMATQRADRKARMTAAATRRTEPDAKPAGQTAVRSKPVRITVDLTPEQHRALAQWLASAAVDVDVPRLTAADAIRSMIRATTTDTIVAGVVLDLIRRSNAVTQ